MRLARTLTSKALPFGSSLPPLSTQPWTRHAVPMLTSTRTRNFSHTSHQRQNEHKPVSKLFDLTGRNYIITGGGQGIGFAMTQAICEMGGNVAVLDLREQPVDAFKALADKHGVKTEYFQTDVAKEESLTSSFVKAVSKLGSLDGLVPAAGVVVDKPFVEWGWDETERIQKINVMGTFFATQLAAKRMMQQGTPGSIVMIASICAQQAAPGHKLSGYHASKGGVWMLSRALAVELAPFGIRCNTISPGYIESDMTRTLRQQYPHLVEIMNKAPPMKRIGNTDDLTGAVTYLLSDASAYTTGSDILVTGGLHVGRIEANSV